MFNKKKINLKEVDHFDYKFTIFTKINLLKDYMITTYVDETSLRFAIYYSRSQIKRNNLSNGFLYKI